MHVTALEVELLIHPCWAAQIATLQWDKAPTKILAEYANYAKVFSPDLAMELSKNTSINDHAIKVIKSKQPSYWPIYTSNLVEPEILKTYIETQLKTGCIRPSKSFAGAFILYDKKLDHSFCLCVNYSAINNLTIKNRYPFPLIGESLKWVGQAKRFT